MTQFICFGSGSSGNCYYLSADGQGLIIDLGIGLRNFKKYFRDYGLSFGAINAILVTHDHTDHIKSVGALSSQFHLPVYALDCVHAGMQRNYFMSKKIATEQQHVIQPGEPFTIGIFTVTPFTVPHDSSANTGYFITTPDTTFCLITDAGHFTPEMEAYVSKARHLVIEANYDADMLQSGPYPAFLKRRIAGPNGHADNADTAAFLAAHLNVEVAHVWLCHLSEENNHPEISLRTVCDTICTEPRLGIEKAKCIETLKRKTPSELYELH